MKPPTTRPPRPGDLCTCGRPAVTVYVTAEHGDVGSCRADVFHPVQTQVSTGSTDGMSASAVADAGRGAA